MGPQIGPSGSTKCAKWAQGCENDTQSGPKRAQMVLKGAQSCLEVVPTVASRVPKSTKTHKDVVENWWAFRHVFQRFSKRICRQSKQIGQHSVLGKAYPEGAFL